MSNVNDLILVDLNDNEIGIGSKLPVHEKGQLHRAFSLFLFDGNRVLIQKRASGKYHCAGLWANTCCSHPGAGQSLEQAVIERLGEECGITGVAVHEAGSFVYRAVFDNGLTEYEYDHVFVGEYNGEVNPNPEEIEELKYVDMEELKKDMLECPGKYAPWFITALGIAEKDYAT